MSIWRYSIITKSILKPRSGSDMLYSLRQSNSFLIGLHLNINFPKNFLIKCKILYDGDTQILVIWALGLNLSVN